MYEKVLLIDYKTLKELKQKIKTEEEYYNFLKKEGVVAMAVYHYDDTLRWVGIYDFISG